jgi:DNA-binding GntR family transcriptional regulator
VRDQAPASPAEANISAASGRKGPAASVTDIGDWADGLLKTRVYEQLLLDIILGELRPLGVLDERSLAARYACGVAGVRDALGRLALEGLVLRRPRVGTVVAPLDIREIEHAFEVRRMLEGRTAALAARNAEEAELNALRTAFDGAEAAIAAGDFRALLAMDRAFHRRVAIATHNPLLARYVLSLENIATRFWIYAMEKQTPDEQRTDVELHRALAKAICARDPERAEAAAARLVGDPPSAYPR